MKTILSKLYIHPFTYILIILSVITGMFKELTMVLFIVIIHEIGHLTAALYYKWNTSKIVIYPFGGCLKFEEKINRSLKEELIILLCGPFFQIILLFLVSYLTDIGFMTYRNYEIFKTYNYTLLGFNLLPIYPLDGGRLLNIFMNYLLPFKKGNKLVVFISVIVVLIMLFLYKNLNFTLMGILLLSELFLYFKRQDFLYNKLLLERYMDSFNFKKLKVILSKDNMYKDCRHVVFYKNKYITEKDYLNKRFKEEK